MGLLNLVINMDILNDKIITKVLLYTNKKTKFQITLTTRYELLSLVEGSTRKSISFEYDSDISEFLRTKFYQLTKININGTPIPQFTTPTIPPEFMLKGQLFDESG